MADIIIQGLSEQDVAVLTVCAELRGCMVNGVPDWKAFYAQHNRDAYSQIKQEIGTIIADDPEMSALMIAKLVAHISAKPILDTTQTGDVQ